MVALSRLVAQRIVAHLAQTNPAYDLGGAILDSEVDAIAPVVSATLDRVAERLTAHERLTLYAADRATRQWVLPHAIENQTGEPT